MAGLPGGGAELFFERLCAAQQRHGDDVLPVIRRDPARAARLRAAGLAPVELAFGGAFDLTTRPRARHALAQFRPAIAIAWMSRAARLAPTGPWVLAGRLGGHYDLRRYRRCAHLIGNTQPLVDWIVGQGWDAARVHHLPNFAADLAGAAPERCGVPAGRPLILALGRLHPNKAFDVLIRALARVPGAFLLLAGDGPERAALERLARASGVAARVRFLGWRDDTAGLLAGADVLCVPSRHEPLGNVVIEAFSAGCPVVAAAAAGPAGLIRDGETGRLVPMNDSDALAAALTAVLGDPARGRLLACAARAEFESRHAERPVLAAWHAGLARMLAAGDGV